jgi:hypothetical protein
MAAGARAELRVVRHALAIAVGIMTAEQQAAFLAECERQGVKMPPAPVVQQWAVPGP